jgi:mycothiol synthase
MIHTQEYMKKNMEVIAGPSIPGLSFRAYAGKADFKSIGELWQLSNDADGIDWLISEKDVSNMLGHMPNFDIQSDLLVANKDGKVVGFVMVNWNPMNDKTIAFRIRGIVHPAWRGRRLGSTLLHSAEAHAATIASGQDVNTPKFCDIWVDQRATAKTALLEKNGYSPARYFIDMVCDLTEPIKRYLLPEGLEVRLAKEENYRAIFKADEEAFQDHWGMRAYTEEDFQHWTNDRMFQPELWKNAWDGDQVAGNVLNFIDHEENEKFQRLRGYTEDISVRRPWRRKGLATALLTLSLEELRKRGMQEASLGVDTENPSGALGLYERVGFRQTSQSAAYKKPLSSRHSAE